MIMFITNEHNEIMNAQHQKHPPIPDLLDTALHAFHAETGIDVRRIGGAHGRETTIAVRTPGGWVEYAPVQRAALYDIVIAQHTRLAGVGRRLLVTRAAHRKPAQTMKDLGVEFIDTAGNAFLNAPHLRVFVTGNRVRPQARMALERTVLDRAGVQVVFALLCKPELIKAPYREIARVAGVALGTVAGVIGGLTREGFVLDIGTQGRRLVRRKELLERWTTGYTERLRTRGLVGRYTTDDRGIWRTVDLHPMAACWGGEVAAFKLGRYMKPEVMTVYARRPANELLLNLKLRQDPQGLVEVRDIFWDFPLDPPDIVPPLLVYADLMATAEPRNVETAARIYDEHIQGYLGEG